MSSSLIIDVCVCGNLHLSVCICHAAFVALHLPVCICRPLIESVHCEPRMQLPFSRRARRCTRTHLCAPHAIACFTSRMQMHLPCRTAFACAFACDAAHLRVVQGHVRGAFGRALACSASAFACGADAFAWYMISGIWCCGVAVACMSICVWCCYLTHSMQRHPPSMRCSAPAGH